MSIVLQDTIPGKVCTVCQQWRPLGEYGLTKLSLDGYEHRCKACRKPRVPKVQHEIRDGVAGKTCTICQAWKPLDQFGANRQLSDGRNYRCKACNAAKSRDLHHADPDVARAKLRSYYRKNAQERKQKVAAYQQANKDKINAYRRAHHQANLEQARKRGRMSTTIRRARVRAAGQGFTAAEWRALCAKYHHTCLCCGQREPDITLSPDHVIPIARGGRGDINNIQPLCVLCNKKKQARHIDYRT